MNYSRRKFLGGAGGIVSLPLFESLLPRKAWGDTTPPPKRFVVYYVPNGRNQDTFKPKEVGGNFNLPTALSPLGPLKDYLTVLSGFTSAPSVNSLTICDHAKAAGPSLTCMPIADGYKANNGISMDQYLVQALGLKTQFPSLQWTAAEPGVNDCGSSNIYTQSISWSNATTPLSPLATPLAAFNQMFAGYDPNATEAQRALRAAAQKSVLDFVQKDAKSLSNHMNAADKTKLDEYLTGVRDIERRLAGGSNICASTAVAPSKRLDHQATVTAFNDLMVLALRCDMSRVITFMLEFELSYRIYDFLFPGQNSAGHHTLSHYGSQTQLDQLIAVETWETKQALDLAQKLKAIPEGDGNLLDNTILLLMPGMGQGANHNHVDIALAMIGKGGGTLKT
ncbi:MAG: DUF1552 domain-containing protein, partial [Proteobacteria bacterium]